ncbi:hypothetical protein MCEMSEM18_00708 [Comamonadaceae bacterium]
MKALIRISVIVCIIYGAIVFAIYESTQSKALEKSRRLRQVEASVVSTERCPGKSLCYVTIAEYKIDGKFAEARVLGEFGAPGTIFSIYVLSGSPKGFLSHAAYIEQATTVVSFLFLPLAMLLIPLFLAVAQKCEKPVGQANENERRA